MKFEVERYDFISGISSCLKATAKKTAGILGNILIETGKGSVKITGYDLQIGITSTIPAAISDSGKICIDGSKISALLAKCTENGIYK